MKNKIVAVLGVGTLGGFVADAISNLDGVETIIIQDPDIVEQKNLVNSIYRQIDVGVKKVEALSDIISSKNPDVTIISIYEKFIEGKSSIPKCDLVLDCRDYTYDRKNIDVRMYMSSRYLMVDCRKNVKYKSKTAGRYLTQLSKEDLRYAGSLVAMLIHNDTIESLRKKQIVQKYELDYVKHIDTVACDIVYEQSDNEEKFINLPDQLMNIIDANKFNSLNCYVGSNVMPLSEFTIPMNSLQSGKDVVSYLHNSLPSQLEFNNYVVSFYNVYGRFVLELIPETGAA